MVENQQGSTANRRLKTEITFFFLYIILRTVTKEALTGSGLSDLQLTAALQIIFIFISQLSRGASPFCNPQPINKGRRWNWILIVRHHSWLLEWHSGLCPSACVAARILSVHPCDKFVLTWMWLDAVVQDDDTSLNMFNMMSSFCLWAFGNKRQFNLVYIYLICNFALVVYCYQAVDYYRDHCLLGREIRPVK